LAWRGSRNLLAAACLRPELNKQDDRKKVSLKQFQTPLEMILKAARLRL
jgi:hypothetical protein